MANYISLPFCLIRVGAKRLVRCPIREGWFFEIQLWRCNMWKNWTDIVSGKLTLGEIMQDIAIQMVHRQPKRIIVDIRLREDCEDKKLNGYWTKIWISGADFKKWK